MTDRPIIFSGSMVRALLDGRKTQTRRVLKPQPPEDVTSLEGPEWYARAVVDRFGELQPGPDQFGVYTDEWGTRVRFQPGDRLWVRENFAMGFDYDDDEKPIGEVPKPFYAATYDGVRWYDTDKDEWRDAPRWTPSIHMPRWASRLTLHVTGVKVERLQDISEADAIAEGVEDCDEARNIIYEDHRTAFVDLWKRLHGLAAWAANPWVVAVTFKVVRANIDSPEAHAE